MFSIEFVSRDKYISYKTPNKKQKKCIEPESGPWEKGFVLQNHHAM